MAYIESVIIRDSGGTEADVTAGNALKVDGSAVTQPVNIVGGSVSANIQTDAFQQTVVSNRYNQIEISYATVDPDLITDITVTKANGGDASNATGQALFTSGANTNGSVTAVTDNNVIYRPHAETYVAFTAIWTSGGLASSVQRIGLFDANNGFFIGYEGTVFGVTLRKGGVDTQTAQASFNIDTLTGTAGSKYTRNGVPEAANFALDNLFRIRFGWLGAAPIQWEIFSPDGEWVLFHIIRHPNTVATPTINDPDLPIALQITKTAAGATVLDMNTACWAAGTSSNFQKVTETINDNTLATLNRSVITGVTTGGGGGYVNVKVNPSGALVTQPDNNYDEDTAHGSGDTGGFILGVRNDANTAMTSNDGDYSPIAVNANGAVAINDGGNSITVDGSVTATVSGTVNATVNYSYSEDVQHVSGDKGAFVLAVRNDDQANILTTNDNDYSPIAVDEMGRVNVVGSQTVNVPHKGGAVIAGAIDNVSGNVLVTNIYDLANNDAFVVGLADKVGDIVGAEKLIETHHIEDDPHTTGDYGNFVLAVRNDANAVVTSTDGDYSQISVNDKGAIAIQDGGNSITVDGTVGVSGTVTVSGTVAATQSGTWVLGANSGVDIGDVTINNAAGAAAVNIQDGGNSITIDGSVTVASGNITAATDTSYAEDSAHTTGSKGTFILAVRNDSNTDFNATDGDYTPIAVTGAGAVKIHDGGNSITVDGTVAATQSGTWNVVAAGDVAHDTADSGNPVKIGFQAETTLPTAVANGDRTNGTADQFGRQLVTHISPGMQTWKSGNYTTTQTGVALWTPAAGKTVAVTYLAVSSYATTAGRVIVWFGASGDTTYTAGTDQLVWAGSFAPTANSKPGAILTFNTPVFSANVDYVLRVTTDANISLDVSVYGYEF
jgi:hypothetical protein